MKKSKKAIVFGSNGSAEVVAFLLDKDSEYTVDAFCVSKKFRSSNYFFGRPLVNFEDVEKIYPPNEYEMYISATYSNQNKIRERFYEEAKNKGYSLLTYISSKATNYSTKIGDNTFIFEDNTIQPFVEIGNNVILWSGNHIGHHSIIEDNVFVSSHVVISGHCRIGRNSFLGVNSTLRDGLNLGAYNTLGAGCLIVKDTLDDKIFIGSRASEFKKS